MRPYSSSTFEFDAAHTTTNANESDWPNEHVGTDLINKNKFSNEIDIKSLRRKINLPMDSTTVEASVKRPSVSNKLEAVNSRKVSSLLNTDSLNSSNTLKFSHLYFYSISLTLFYCLINFQF